MAFQMIRFSLADPYLSKLKQLTPEGESIHTFLKQIACEALIPSKELPGEIPPIDSNELEAITERLSVLENEIGNCFIAYKDLRDHLDKFQLQIQGSYAIAEKCTELFNNQEARLKALEEAPGRSQKKRDANGRFLKKGETDE